MNKSRLVISDLDFETLSQLTLNQGIADPHLKECIKRFQIDLLRATIIVHSEMPADVVRLNSIVTVNTPYGRKENMKLVLPNFADIKRKKLSVLSPLGMAIMGKKEGGEAIWYFPTSEEKISIEKVENTGIQAEIEFQGMQ